MMSASRARLFCAPETAPPMLPPDGLVDVARTLADAVHRLVPMATPGARPYLVDAEKHLRLAVSAMSIAQLVEPEPGTPGAG